MERRDAGRDMGAIPDGVLAVRNHRGEGDASDAPTPRGIHPSPGLRPGYGLANSPRMNGEGT